MVSVPAAGALPEREKAEYSVSSLEALSEKGMIPEGLADNPEDTVIRKLCVEKLQAE